MGVDVDEAGGDHLTRGVELASPRKAVPMATIIPSRTATSAPGPVRRPVDQCPAPYDDLAVHRRSLSIERRAR